MRQKLKKLMIGAFASIVLLAGAFTTSSTAQTFIIKRHRVIVFPPVVTPIYRPVYQPIQYPVYQPVYQPIQYPVYQPVYYPNYWVVYPTGNDWDWGYREGRDEGKDDAEDGRIMNPTIHSDYYKSGSYTYRQAFIQGYYDGYLRKIRD
jgi:hypothetical protein